MASTVVGLFDDRDHAQQAVQDLISAGIDRSKISVVAADTEGKFQKSSVDESGTLAGEGALSGATSGALVGGIFGLLVGAGALAFPAVGLVAIGPISGLLTGAGIGAVSGGIIGGLIGLGIPEEHAETYAEGVRRGGTLVTVQANDNQTSQIESILDRDGAVDIDERRAQYQAQGFTKFDANAPVIQEKTMSDQPRYQIPNTTTTETTEIVEEVQPTNLQATTPPVVTTQPTNLAEGQKLEVVKEELAVGKREVEQGGVRVRSYVTETPVTEQVTLTEEHVNVERHAVNRPVDAHTLDTFKEGTIELREHAEVPVVAKEARVVEEITIGKTAQQHTETISDTVRETHVDVEQLTNEFRTDFNTRYGQTSGASFEQYQPAYQYGFQASQNNQFQGRDFSTAEADLRTGYEAQNPGLFDTHRDAIQTGYTRGTASGLSGRAYADNPNNR
jgi:uncharacterized protein (TIGR02271 family)